MERLVWSNATGHVLAPEVQRRITIWHSLLPGAVIAVSAILYVTIPLSAKTNGVTPLNITDSLRGSSPAFTRFAFEQCRSLLQDLSSDSCDSDASEFALRAHSYWASVTVGLMATICAIAGLTFLCIIYKSVYLVWRPQSNEAHSGSNIPQGFAMYFFLFLLTYLLVILNRVTPAASCPPSVHFTGASSGVTMRACPITLNSTMARPQVRFGEGSGGFIVLRDSDLFVGITFAAHSGYLDATETARKNLGLFIPVIMVVMIFFPLANRREIEQLVDQHRRVHPIAPPLPASPTLSAVHV